MLSVQVLYYFSKWSKAVKSRSHRSRRSHAAGFRIVADLALKLKGAISAMMSPETQSFTISLSYPAARHYA